MVLKNKIHFAVGFFFDILFLKLLAMHIFVKYHSSYF